MKDLYIGIMSGTSMDGIDAVLVSFDPILTVINTHQTNFPKHLRAQISTLCAPSSGDINTMGEVDYQLGHLYAECVQTLLNNSNIKANQIKAIGNHGQTIRHYPNQKMPFTLQIGDANIIAAKTGITTVADFRRKDMAVGGQGAPLVPAFHQDIFASNQENRVILNVGGMANITILNKNQPANVIGFDTGPGNVLMDLWITQHQQKPYDNSGKWARSGKYSASLLDNLLAEPFFALPPPKSTGRELFNNEWLRQFSLEKHSAENVQATLLELTAHSIAKAIASLTEMVSIP